MQVIQRLDKMLVGVLQEITLGDLSGLSGAVISGPDHEGQCPFSPYLGKHPLIARDI